MQKYQYISFWRVIACIGVFVVHLGLRMQLEGSLRVVTDFGRNGVVIFFILTGFLALNSKDVRENKILYWKKRAVKILPLYIAILLFYFLSQLIQTQNLKLAAEYVIGENVGGTWTMHTFILFYLIAPFIVKIVDSYRSACIFWLITFVMRIVLSTFNLGSSLSPLRHLCFCAMGVVLFYAIKEKKEHSMIFAALSIAIIWLVQSSDDYFLIYSLLFVVMIFSSQKISVKEGKFKNIVEVIDKYSYEIYLSQEAVGYLLVDGRQLNRITVLVYMLVGTVVAVAIVYWMIERPCEKLFQRWEKIES